ncbi:MAG: ABC transporter ATP-binding protein [Tenuifilaceae bacterium]|nr:ABC transporter ATP-binding protein [Tenuifilaceae bacterium]
MFEIEVNNLTKYFEQRVIFEKLSFLVKKGQKVTITGASGKGKTTLLRMLAGVIAPDEGCISFNNQVFNSQTAHIIRQQIAYLPQGIDLMVSNGVELAQLLQIEPKSAFSYLEKLLLSPNIMQQPFAEISGGEKQRMLISLILSLQRPILFLDEPTSALDKNSSEKLMDLIWSNPNISMVSTSHNPEWEERCEQVIQL